MANDARMSEGKASGASGRGFRTGRVVRNDSGFGNVIRDRHYNAILEGLSAPRLDHDAFERCAADLLRGIYPRLTPVVGGRDLGMDGLDTSDPDAPKILVTTTGQDVRGNLVRNLQSHKSQSESIGARHVVVATTRQATGSLHESLREAAFGQGFQLVAVHGREALADLLYGSSRWTRELLGLSGAPSALSAVPASSRLLSDLPLIGRTSDKQWLADSCGDIVISGHPASGKTHLLRQFVDQGWLFAVDSAREGLAYAVRDSNPEVVVVDDAHVDLVGLASLGQLRSDIGADFRIAAVTWPGDKDSVADRLGVPEDSILDLRLLTRDEILEVVKAMGITGSIELQRLIVNQSGGRPGLTATLCDHAIRDDIRPLLSGESLLRDFRLVVEGIGDQHGLQVLAVMAIAGKSGASLSDVQSVLGLSIAESQVSMASLGHTGVFQTGSLAGKATVWPRELRFAVVREVFFSPNSHLNLPLDSAMQHLDERGVIGSLVGAASVGAQVPSDTVESVLRRSGSSDDYRQYALLGQRQARFALSSRPEWLIDIAPYSVLTDPETTLRMLFDKAEADRRVQHSHPDHPIRIVKDWIETAQSLQDEQLERRRLLKGAADSYARDGGNSQVVFQALCLAMSPCFESNRLDPGSGHKGLIQQGIASRECLAGLVELWQPVLNAMTTNSLEDYSAVFEMLRAWTYFGKLQQSPPADIRQLMLSHASTMTSDIAIRFSAHPGVLTLISELTSRSDLDVHVQIPEPFSVFYPSKAEWKDMEAQSQRWRADARRVADELEPLGVVSAMSMLLDVSKRAAEVGRTWPDMTGEVAARIAQRTLDPHTWADHAIDFRLTPAVVEPLLRRARECDRERTLLTMKRALGTASLRVVAVQIVLSSADPLDEEMQIVLELIGQHYEYVGVIEHLVAQQRIPVPTIRKLLHHPSSYIAEVVAVLLSITDQDPIVLGELHDDWKAAILRATGKSDMISIVFKSNSDVFVDWLTIHIEDGSLGDFYWITDHLTAALSNLSVSQRLRVLDGIPEQRGFSLSRVIADLVGDDLHVFEKFLSMPRFSRIHQAAFASVSLEKIESALRFGWTNQQIASAIMNPSVPFSMMGEESEVWRKRCDYFSSLSESSDAKIAAVGRTGYAMAQANLDASLSRERDEDVYGHQV